MRNEIWGGRQVSRRLFPVRVQIGLLGSMSNPERPRGGIQWLRFELDPDLPSHIQRVAREGLRNSRSWKSSPKGKHLTPISLPRGGTRTEGDSSIHQGHSPIGTVLAEERGRPAWRAVYLRGASRCKGPCFVPYDVSLTPGKRTTLIPEKKQTCYHDRQSITFTDVTVRRSDSLEPGAWRIDAITRLHARAKKGRKRVAIFLRDTRPPTNKGTDTLFHTASSQ